MSLFLKIFLWFWLAIAILIGAFLAVTWTTQNEPVARQFRSMMAESFQIQAQTTAQIYQNEGLEGLNEYLGRLKTSERIIASGVYGADGVKIAGDDLIARNRRLFDQTLGSDATEFDRTLEETIAARTVGLKDGRRIVVMTQMRRPIAPAVFEPGPLAIRILVLFLTGGLVCYGLARYLTRPLSRLGETTRRLASGDLSARVGVAKPRGGDEITRLSRDFDDMAERIETLIKSEKRLTQDISHELRSPLARLGVALELARKKSVPETAPALERIETESLRLNEMISRLLVLSKLESGAVEVSKTTIDFSSLVRETVADADFEARAKGREVKLSLADDVKLSGSSDLLRSAVENVLRNAVRYTAESTAVDVSLQIVHGQVELRVVDHGGGVPETEIDKLFKPFYRVGEARERKSGGVGLGLAIAERAIHAHGGAITARNLGDGLEVTIKLPLNGARR